MSLYIKEWDIKLEILVEPGNYKYYNLIKGLAPLSDKCTNDIEFFNQWSKSTENLPSHVDKCHCTTPIVHNIGVKNYHTNCSTIVGNVCKKYFNNDVITEAFEDKKYKKLTGFKRRKCGRCRTNIRRNNKTHYCVACRKIMKDKKEPSNIRNVKILMKELKTNHSDKLASADYKILFGKYKGLKLKHIPMSYLLWMKRQTWYYDYGSGAIIDTFLKLRK